MEDLEENPLIFSVNNDVVQAQRASEFISMEDLEYIDAKQNVRKNARLQGKIDFKPTLNTNITLGGNFVALLTELYLWLQFV